MNPPIRVLCRGTSVRAFTPNRIIAAPRAPRLVARCLRNASTRSAPIRDSLKCNYIQGVKNDVKVFSPLTKTDELPKDRDKSSIKRLAVG